MKIMLERRPAMKNFKEVLKKCSDAGIELWTENGKLKYKASANTLSDNMLANLKKFKPQIMEYLEKAGRDLSIIHDYENRYEAFPLTEVQSAYLLGREDYFDYGNTACHIYQEFVYERLDADKVEQVWNLLINEHDALRTVIYKAGYQKVLKKNPYFKVQKINVQSDQSSYDELRKNMENKIFPLEKWPMFEIAVSQHKDKSILHFSMDFLIADWSSIWQLLKEFEDIYFENRKTETTKITFRDYVLYEERRKKYQKYEEDKLFWLNRIEKFFMAPTLPQITNDSEHVLNVEFERHSLNIAPQKWKKFKHFCNTFNVTPTAAVLTVYSDVLKKWSLNKDICLNLTVLNRDTPNEEVNRIVGDFTKIVLLEVENIRGKYYERVQKINADLFESLDHCGYSGIDVIRDIAKSKGRENASMPFVFTSAIGVIKNTLKGKYEGQGISQTPQVFIDCQAMDGDFGLQINWDVRKNVFKNGIVEDMFATFQRSLAQLTEDFDLWQHRLTVDLPVTQKERRNLVNSKQAAFQEKLLFEDFWRISKEHPEYPAIYDAFGKVSYRELRILSISIAEVLRKEGVGLGDRVIIAVPKNRYQIGAVLGVLIIGGVYVPMDINSPINRTKSIIEQCNSKIILKTTDVVLNCKERCIDLDTLTLINREKFNCAEQNVEEPAYVIFTSGTTGTPKGVIVSHRAAWNTICDINNTYKVTYKDCILALSKLNFDLSVYDIFGLLSVGGAIAYVDDANYMNPECWFEIINKYNVTIWNSVPALRSLYLLYLKDHKPIYKEPIRLSLLSGDRIPKEMPREILGYNKNEQIICLGGATEAAIWSISHEYKLDETFPSSIPYGRPLSNQRFFVVDKDGEDCPDWCPGELLIAGEGLAKGYIGDAELTKKKFFYSKIHNCRVYATGDIGRYMPTGEIEFIGRKDGQVKVHGYRIELGEIENALVKQKGINRAIVRVNTKKKELPIEAVIEIKPVDLEEKEEVILKHKKLCENIKNVNLNYEKRLIKLDFSDDFAKRDEFAFVSILRGLEKIGCFDKYYTFEEIINNEEINIKYRWLLLRWINVLLKNGYIYKKNGQYFMTRYYSETEYELLGQSVFANWKEEYGDISFMSYLYDAGKQLPEILRGKVDPVSVLYPEGSNKYTQALYVTNATSKVVTQYYCCFISEYIKRNPGRKIRILEIGAGTGATTIPVIEALSDADYEYYFTDIAQYFLPAAKRLFKNNNKVIIRQFNVDEHYTKQGFEPNYFDIVIGAYVLENVKDIQKSINIIKDLIAPQGYLLFSEPIKDEPWIMATQALMMVEPQDEIRKDIFFVSPNCWKEILDKSDTTSETKIFPPIESALYNLGTVFFIKQFKSNLSMINREKIKEGILKYIPEYMEPKNTIYLNKLPLTTNAKIDTGIAFSYIPENTSIKIEHEVESNEANDFGKTLLTIWKEILGIKQLGVEDNFYDYGADSLIIAQATTKMRDGLKLNIPFETLLKETINNPTVSGCAKVILDYSEDREKTSGKQEVNSIYYVEKYNDINTNSVRVLVHGALGNIDNYLYLGQELSKWKSRSVIAFGIADYAQYMQLDTNKLIVELAEQYSKYIINHEWSNVQLIGYSFSGSIIIEMARLLVEQGTNVDSVVIIEGGTIPIDIKSEFFSELLFLESIGISEKSLGITKVSVLNAVFKNVKEQNLVSVDNPLLVSSMDSQEDKEKINDMIQKTSEQRLNMYQMITNDKRMLKKLFPVYAKSLKALQIVPNLYLGDVTYCYVNEKGGLYQNISELTEKWKDVLLGNIEKRVINGNHYTCMDKKHSLDLANLLVNEVGDDILQESVESISNNKDSKNIDMRFFEENQNYLEFALYKRKESILYAMICFMKSQGIFVDTYKYYTYQEIKGKIKVIPQKESILRRWLTTLKEYGFLIELEGKFALCIQVTDNLFYEVWKQMLKLWNGKLCSELANEYLLKNIKALPELFSGKINATHILFPEGKFDYANALYKDTYIFKYLNAYIYERMEELGQKNKAIKILELGAGTGATTDTLLPLVKGNPNIAYYFTDVSQVFLREAMRRYCFIPNMLYAKVDINSIDFQEQVDVIIANGVLNNSKKIRYTVDKMLNLMRPRGTIFILEQVEESLEMLVSQVFMMENTSDTDLKQERIFRTTDEWLKVFNNEKIGKVEVYPSKFSTEQKLFVIHCK